MPIVDTHCHYNMEPLALKWQEHWRKAQEKGVVGSVIIGVDITSSNLALEMVGTELNLLASVGAHPTDAQGVTVEQLNEAGKTWAGKAFAAVGETGLDFYRLDRNNPEFEKQIVQQKEIFRWHLQFAQQQDLPLILHVRDKTDQAYFETLEILKTEYKGNKPFVLHCASGPSDYIQQAVKMGGYVGFDGNITYPQAQDVRDLVKSVPADRLMIETDAPFLAPQEFRGKVCEPWMIAETAQYVEQELGLNLNQIFENNQIFFGHTFTK